MCCHRGEIMCLYRMFQLRPCPVFLSTTLLIYIPRHFCKITLAFDAEWEAPRRCFHSEVFIKQQTGVQQNAIIDPLADTVTLKMMSRDISSVTICRCLETI